MTTLPQPPTSAQTLFAASLFHYDTIAQIDRQRILESLTHNKFVCLRGLLSPERVRQAKATLQAAFDAANDHPSIGEKPSEAQTNFQKLSIGATKTHPMQESYGRFLRVIFNPMWQDDIYAMHDIFERLIQVRNLLAGQPLDFASRSVEDGLWSATRILQYPTGGGYLQAHRDAKFSFITSEAEQSYYQVFTVLSEKGKDFERGGGFIEIDGQNVVLDDLMSLGDITIYDGATRHGVEIVDPHKTLDMSCINGRLSAFVNLYQDWASGLRHF